MSQFTFDERWINYFQTAYKLVIAGVENVSKTLVKQLVNSAS